MSTFSGEYGLEELMAERRRRQSAQPPQVPQMDFSLEELMAERQRRRSGGGGIPQAFQDPNFQEPDPFSAPPPTRQLRQYTSPQAATISEAITGGTMGRDVLLTGKPVDPRQQLVADILLKYRNQGQNVSVEEASQIADNITRENNTPALRAFQPDLSLLGQRAAARLQAEQEGQAYQDPEQREADLSILGAENNAIDRSLNAGRAEDLGQVGTFVLGAADTASFGLGGLARRGAESVLSQGGSTTGLETEATMQRPVASIAGQIGGGVVPIGKIAQAAAKGGAALAGRAGLTGASKAVAAGAAGFGAGELAQAPASFIRTVRDGGSVEQAFEEAGRAAAAYPLLAAKMARVASGSEETFGTDDVLNLAMLLPEYLGARADIMRAIRDGRPLHVNQARDLAKALDIESRKLAAFQNSPDQQLAISQEALRIMGGEEAVSPVDTSVVSDGGVAGQRVGQDPQKLFVDEQNVAGATTTPDLSAQGPDLSAKGPELPPSSMEAVPRRRDYFENRTVPELERPPTARTSAEEAAANERAFIEQEKRHLTPVERAEIEALQGGKPPPAKPDPKRDAARQKLLGMTPEQRSTLRQQAQARPDAKFLVEEIDRLESERFTERPGDRPSMEQRKSYSEALRSRQYQPERFVHQTSLEALESIANEGLQAGKADEASGFDVGIFATKTDKQGKLVAPSYGRDKVPVALELSARVEGGMGRGGHDEVNSPGKGYVEARDIERVYIGSDPHPYTLQEAVARLKENAARPQPAKAEAPSLVQRARDKEKAQTDLDAATQWRKDNPDGSIRQFAKAHGVSFRRAREALIDVGKITETKAPEPTPVEAQPPDAAPAPEMVSPEPVAPEVPEPDYESMTLGQLRTVAKHIPGRFRMKKPDLIRALKEKGAPSAPVPTQQENPSQPRAPKERPAPRSAQKEPLEEGQVEEVERLPEDEEGIVDEPIGQPAQSVSPIDPDGPSGMAATPVQVRRRLKQQARMGTEPSSPQRMIYRLSKALDIGSPGIGKSRMLKKNALGWYMTRPEVIRQRFADQMSTFVHEVGHHLHKVIFQGRQSFRRAGIDPNTLPQNWQQELHKGGFRLYGGQKPTAGYASEGWAEFVRELVTEPAKAKKNYPTVYAEAINRMMTEFPAEYEALLQFRKDYAAFSKATPFTKAVGYIREHPLKDRPVRPLARWTSWLFDETHALVELKKDLKLKDLPSDKDPHRAALRARGHVAGDFDVAIRNGTFDPVSLQITGKGLNEIIAPVRRHLEQWQVYMALRRAQEKRGQGYKGIFPEITDKEIADGIAEAEKAYGPEFEQAAKDFQDFNQWLIRDYAVHHGLITKAQASKIIRANLDYITFAPVRSELESTLKIGGVPQKFTETGTGIRRFAKDAKGYAIEPPLQSFLASMEGIMTRAHMNNIGKLVADLSMHEQAGRWFRRIDRPIDATVMSGEDIMKTIAKRMADQGIDPTQMDEATLGALVNLIEADDFTKFTAGFRVDEKTGEFSILRNGKPEFYEANMDGAGRYLFEFLKGMHSTSSLQGFWKLLTVPRTLYRAGATVLNPSFFVVNFLRDFTQAAVFSGVKPTGGIAGAKHRQAARWNGFLQAIAKGKPSDLYKLSGASQSGLFGEYVDAKTKRFKLDEVFERPKVPVAFLSAENVARRTKQVLTLVPFRVMNERFELANRLAEFEGNLAQGDVLRARNLFNTRKPSTAQIQQAKGIRSKADVLDAGAAAADITLDFTRGGSVTKQINQFIPFFNAAFLGGNKLYRFAKKNPADFAARTFSYIILPSVVQHIMNRDDEEYWNLPFEQRDRAWHFGLGDFDGDGVKEYITIPRPYGMGIFAVMTDRLLAYADGIDPVSGKRGDPGAFRGLGAALIKDFRPPYTVPIILPVMEMIMNYSLFYGGNIVRKGEQKGPKGERGAERSSDLAEALGGLMDIEPPIIDYAISGIFAGLGTDINQYVVSPAVRLANEEVLGNPPRVRKTKKPTQLEFMPLLKRLLTEEPGTHSETMIRFWNQFSTAEDHFRGFRDREEHRPDEADAYYDQHFAKIEAYEAMQPYKSDLDHVFKELDTLYRDGSIGEKDRRKQERKLIDEIHSVAREGLEALHEVRKERSDD